MRSRATLPTLSAVLVVLTACAAQEPPPKLSSPPPPPKDPPVVATIASACARISACTHSHDAARFRDPGACVDWWLGGGSNEGDEGEPLRRCLASATTCAKVSACMHGGGDARAAAFCSQRADVFSGCDGDRLVTCGEDDAHESTVVDCAKMGATCRETKAAGGLVVRACFSPQKCPPGAPEARCDGPGAVISCRDGALERAVCRAGTTCQERRDEAGEAAALCEVPGQRRCDLRGARHCENDRLVECDRSGHTEKVTDCIGFGLRCAGVGPRAGCYVPANVECDKELLPRCEGGSVVFCAAGRLAKVACSSIGLGACDPAAKGPMAGCVPAPSTSAAPPK